jgi:anti-sigma factor RsiW
MNDQHAADLIGAYVLGSLEATERHEVEDHLRLCMDCVIELSELEPLRELLDQLTPEDVEAAQVRPSFDLFDRVAVAAAADGERPVRRRRLVRPALVAAALVLLAGAGAGVAALGSHGYGGNSFATAAGSVHMSVGLGAAKSGTTLRLTVAGLPKDEHCWLVAIASDGSRHPAGQWVATWSGTAEFTGSTDVSRGQLRQIVLFGTHGQRLVSVSV